MPTIRQLAALAGVSHSTVSRALRDDPQISRETRQRIQALAREYHYQPNRLAQGALSGASRLFGLISGDLAVPYCARILRGICDAAYGAGYQVLMIETQGELPRTLQAVHTLLEHRVEGIFIAHAHATPLPRQAVLEMVSNNAVPVLLDYSRADFAMPRVCTDETALAEVAVTYLQGLGHRHIAFVGPPIGGFRGERATAIRHVMAKHGLSIRYLVDWQATTFRDFNGEPALECLLAYHPRPTAIIGFEDHVAAKLIQAAQRRHLHVPSDISILGCANLNIATFTAPPLTSVEQYPEEIGRQACQYLLSRIANPDMPPDEAPAVIPIASTLVIRDSCAPPQALLT